MLIAALSGGCTQIQDLITPTPNVPGEWNALLHDIRAFEQRIGFQETQNFQTKFDAKGDFSICGYAPRTQLPYSYQDPMIRWGDARNAQDCAAAAKDEDVYFTQVEAVGEIGTAVTSTMIDGKLDRFIYLVIHENCHDQFDLPYGIEEALCNLLGYRGMAAFSEEKYGAKAREDRAIRRYAESQSKLTHAVVGYYRQIEQLYARYAKKEITLEALMRERARLFAGAERTFGWRRQAMNNVALANEMTYSRHYAQLEAVYERLGRDLTKTVAFFRKVDAAKPTRDAIRKRYRLSEGSVELVQAYEDAVMATVESLLNPAPATLPRR